MDALRLIPALLGMPSLAAAERALLARHLGRNLSRIERMVGFTIIERTRPLTTTGPGQKLLARVERLFREL
ncbi:hypothetical protein OHS70_34465 [Streptomyces sp. NBC_00390]|uniref:hypothetical protein n=1 Tax=Streptomyces sp. NBC_00390 TaxID=2975736 RepID=UPI002E1BE895